MNKTLFLLMLTAGFMACTKNNTDVPASPHSNVAKIKTWMSGASLATYTYDAQGRLISKVRNDGSGYEYDYLPGVVNEKRYTAGHVLNTVFKNELDANGHIARRTASNDASYEELFSFNADGSMAKNIGHYSGGNTQVIDFFYSNGNCDSTRFTGNNGNWSLTIQRTYYTDKLNSIGYENTGETFWGNSNKNLLKTEIYKYSNGGTNMPSSFGYDLDASGRVTKQTGTAGNNINIDIFTYY